MLNQNEYEQTDIRDRQDRQPARGGEGGGGNASFVTSCRQTSHQKIAKIETYIDELW